ncbi:hypothetical protein RI054_18g84200 [Pseudoscourfieldia marina]
MSSPSKAPQPQPPSPSKDTRADIIIERWMKQKSKKTVGIENLRQKRLTNERSFLEKLAERQQARNHVFEVEERRENAAKTIQTGFYGMKDRKAVRVLKEEKRRNDVAMGRIDAKGNKLEVKKTEAQMLNEDSKRLFG